VADPQARDEFRKKKEVADKQLATGETITVSLTGAEKQAVHYDDPRKRHVVQRLEELKNDPTALRKLLETRR